MDCSPGIVVCICIQTFFYRVNINGRSVPHSSISRPILCTRQLSTELIGLRILLLRDREYYFPRRLFQSAAYNKRVFAMPNTPTQCDSKNDQNVLLLHFIGHFIYTCVQC